MFATALHAGQPASFRLMCCCQSHCTHLRTQVKDAQPDALLMKHFLSAFSDEDSVAIVTHCRQVLAPQGRVLLLQTLVPEPGDKAHNTCEDGVAPGRLHKGSSGCMLFG